MSIDCYMNIDGKSVKGESIQKNHTDEIELFNWTWGAHNSSCTVGSGSAVGKGTPGMITVSKRYDRSSTVLAKSCASGTHFKEVILSMDKASGKDDGQQVFMKVTLNEVYISDINVSATKGGDVLENVTMSYGKFKVEYSPQKTDGSLETAVQFSWDTRSTEATN